MSQKKIFRWVMFLMLLITPIVALWDRNVFSLSTLSSKNQVSVKVLTVENVNCNEMTSISNSEEPSRQVLGFTSPQTGEYTEITRYLSDYDAHITKGDKIILTIFEGENHEEVYKFSRIDRSLTLLVLLVLFCVVTVVIGGISGARSLVSLMLSLGIIIGVVIPLIRDGLNPLMVIFMSGIFLVFVTTGFIYGISKVSMVAVLGTSAGLLFALMLSLVVTNSAQITGYTNEFGYIDDQTFMLLNSTENVLNMKDLLMGCFLLGSIGIIDDVTVSQAFVVQELLSTGKKFSVQKLYCSAMNVGKSHIASMVNTLFMAYISVALPTLLLTTTTQSNLIYFINTEFFAIEVIRTLVGSIGLMVALPITTLLAAVVLNKKQD